MKKAVKILLILGVLSLLFTFRISATEKSGEYTIREEGEEYVLSDITSEIGRYEKISDCFSGMSTVRSVCFDNVSSDEPIELPRGSYSVTGKLTSSRNISVPKGCSVTFSSFSLTLFDGALLRIKGGLVEIESSDISSSEGTLIRLDYSSSSSLILNSGSLMGEHEGALIDIKSGSAYLFGGSVTNKSGSAVRNDGELVLANSPVISGVPYGIILESPMHLSDGESKYRSSIALSVMYDTDFPLGTLTEVFYGADAESVKGIELYDKNGKKAEISYFDKTHHTSEECFGGVYLPYTVKYYVDGTVVFEEGLLFGERAEGYTPTAKEGYTFAGWYTDSDLSESYAFDKGVCSDFNLFARYDLAPPEFSISSIERVFDGELHYLAFENVFHPVPNGYYSYKWYKDGVEISTLSAVPIRCVSDSGVYSCAVTYTYNGKTATSYATNINVLIKPKVIEPPTIASAEYTGDLLFPTVSDTSYYTVVQSSGTSVGRYAQRLVLKDPENTVWENIEGDECVVYFEITRAENYWIEEPHVYDSYFGCPVKADAIARFGDVTYVYSSTSDGTYKPDVPMGAGTYYAKAQVAECENYSGLISEPMSFTVIAEQVVGLKLASPPTKTSYSAFEAFDTEGMSIKAIYNSGRESSIGNTSVEIVYSSANTLRVGDSGVIVEYEGASLLVPLTVTPLSYDVSALEIKDFSVTYDAAYHTLDSIYKEIVGLDGIPLKYTVSGGGSACGDYYLTVDFFTESRDYLLPEPISVKMTVLPRRVSLTWSETSFVYDGTSKRPTASFVDALGVRRFVFVRGANVSAGDNYVAEALQYSPDYVYDNPTATYSISKADYDISNVKWSQSSLVYTGDYVDVTLSDLPDGVSVVGYTDNRAKEAGEYYATVSLSYDSQNYNAPIVEAYRWVIKKADFDLSGISFEDSEYIFDGTAKYPALIGTLPQGADGSELCYKMSDGVVNVSDGWRTVTLSFTTDSKNYNVPKSLTARVRVIPKSVYVLWTNDNFTYDGSPHAPTASSEITSVRVDGAMTCAGKYTATATSLDSNYSIANPTFEYEIAKAQNRWTSYPTIEDFYESHSPSPSASAYYGNVEFRYYTDSTLSNEIKYFPISASAYSTSTMLSYPSNCISAYPSNCLSPYSAGSISACSSNGISSYFASIISAYPSNCLSSYSAATILSNSLNSDSNASLDIKARDLIKSGINSSLDSDGNVSLNTKARDLIKSGIDSSSDNDTLNFLNGDMISLPHGKYYMVATVPESDNYLSLTSEPIEFYVIEVVAVGISASVSYTPTAFDTIVSDGYTVSLLYNDGSTADITSASEVIYENASSFRATDKSVSFAYGDFSVSIPISVKKAEYDLSELLWDKSDVTYDGDEHAPTLLNIPSGITLLGYDTKPQILAGTYIFSAIISYDDENYITPAISPCTFTISKATVQIPEAFETVYSGESIVLPESELYSAEYDTDIRMSGRYSVKYALKDNANYVFENGNDTCESWVTVIPLSIDVTVADFDLYLFESEDIISPEYILSTMPIGEDKLDLYFYIDGDDIYVATKNPNYTLNVQCGRLNRVSYPKESLRRKIIAVFISVVFILIFAFLLYKKRDDVTDAFYMARAKRKNRAFIGYIDNGDHSCDTTDNYNISHSAEHQVQNEYHIKDQSADHRQYNSRTASGYQKQSSDQLRYEEQPHHNEQTNYDEQSKHNDPTNYDGQHLHSNPTNYDEQLQRNDLTNYNEQPQHNDQANYDGWDRYNDQIQNDSQYLYYDRYISIGRNDGDLSLSYDENIDDLDNERENRERFKIDKYDQEKKLSAEPIEVATSQISNPPSVQNAKSDDIENKYISGINREPIYEQALEFSDSANENCIDNETAEALSINNKNQSFGSTSSSDSLYIGVIDESRSDYTEAESTDYSSDDEPRIKVKMEEAESMLSDSMAKNMIRNEKEVVYTEGRSRSVVNVDTLSRNFFADDRVDVNILKEKSLVPYDTGYVKVLARGAIDKPLKVYANDFSLSAVKMILLSGGETRRVVTVNKEKGKKYRRNKRK